MYKIILLITFSLLGSVQVYGLDSCSLRLEPYALALIDNTIEPRLFKNSKKILVLSDGATSQDVSIAEMLYSLFPNKKIYSTDFAIKGTSSYKNFISMFMDNRKDFPFADNSMDTILLRKGLCRCNGTHCCAGFVPNTKESNHFFSEVIRVLDTDNPHSVALLHGSFNLTQDIEQVWKKVLTKLEKKRKVKIDFIYGDKNHMFFQLIRIRPAI